MKIFSLQSKTSLAIWSLIFGLAGFFILEIEFFSAVLDQCTSTLDDVTCTKSLRESYGILLPFQNEYINMIFWVLISLIILSLIRHFRNKKPNLK